MNAKAAKVDERDRARIMQALRLAFDSAAPEGEQRAAFLGILRIVKSKGWTIETFRAAIGEVVEVEVETEPDEPFGWDIEMPWGKHVGKTLGEIARTAPDYLDWLSQQPIRNRRLMDAIRSVVEWLDEQ